MNKEVALTNRSNWFIQSFYTPAELKENQYLSIEHRSGFKLFLQSCYATSPSNTLQLIQNECQHHISQEDWQELSKYITQWINDLNTDFYQ